jgi:hypothetical protein
LLVVDKIDKIGKKKGSTNKEGHKAGGKRKGSGRRPGSKNENKKTISKHGGVQISFQNTNHAQIQSQVLIPSEAERDFPENSINDDTGREIVSLIIPIPSMKTRSMIQKVKLYLIPSMTIEVKIYKIM